MNLLIKLFFVLLIGGVVGLFFLKSPTGQPLITTQDIVSKAKSIAQEGQKLTKNKEEVYRWKDKEGKWQYSNIAPSDKQAKTVEQNINIIPSKPKKSPTSETKSTPTQSVKSTQNTSPLNAISPTTISPDKISKLIEDAKNVQQLMDKRTPQINTQLKK